MNEDNSIRQESPRRIFAVEALGDTLDELELFALDKARELFGPEPQLEVIRDYTVTLYSRPEKRYRARMDVRLVES